MDIMTWVWFFSGLVLLIVGAESLVRGASVLAAAVGISPLVIGLTVVAFGTSAPELAVSVTSVYKGQAGIALGNVLGSNIANVLLILGLSALAAPLLVSRRVVQREVPLMIGVSLVVPVVAFSGVITRLNGILMFSGIVAYTAISIFWERSEQQEAPTVDTEPEPEPEPAKTPTGRSGSVGRIALQFVFIGVGLALLYLGSEWLVGSASTIARHFGLSELVIGLTVVSVGTSLPELATSVVAALRGQREMAVGNIVGSNVFNILCVLGATAAVAPEGIRVPSSALYFDIPVMIAVAVACLPITFTGHIIRRWEGCLFLAYYVAYTSYLILRDSEHDSLPMFSGVMFRFVIPLTVITLAILTYRHWRFKSRAENDDRTQSNH
ncbi:calcium/sodium antiporter [soil metagenome]